MDLPPLELGWTAPGPFDFFGDPTAMAPLPPPLPRGQQASASRTTVATTRDHKAARQPRTVLRAWPLDLLPVPVPAFSGDLYPVGPHDEAVPGFNVASVPRPTESDVSPTAATDHATAGVASQRRQIANQPAAPNLADGSRAPRKGTDAAVGLYVQPNNTHTTPGQPQSPLPSPDELPRSPSTSATGNTRQLRERARPATPNANELPGSSTTVATSNAPSRKRARPSTTAAADADRDAKRRNVLPEANRADNGATEEETPAALARRLCTERGLSSKTDPWVPIPCFLCEERRAAAKAAGEKVKAAKPKPWKKWSSLRRHVRGCVVADMKHKWPVCHFCKKPIRASGRPDQMARHLAGDGGYRACKPLQGLIRGGATTNGALADWLLSRNLPIDKEFLGEILANALALASNEEPVGRDAPHGIPLRKRAKDEDDTGDQEEAGEHDANAEREACDEDEADDEDWASDEDEASDEE